MIIKDIPPVEFVIESVTEFLPGDAVEITVRGEIFLGEVGYVRQEKGKRLVGVKLRHSLESLGGRDNALVREDKRCGPRSSEGFRCLPIRTGSSNILGTYEASSGCLALLCGPRNMRRSRGFEHATAARRGSICIRLRAIFWRSAPVRVRSSDVLRNAGLHRYRENRKGMDGENAPVIPWSVFEESGSPGVSLRICIPKRS